MEQQLNNKRIIEDNDDSLKITLKKQRLDNDESNILIPVFDDAFNKFNTIFIDSMENINDTKLQKEEKKLKLYCDDQLKETKSSCNYNMEMAKNFVQIYKRCPTEINNILKVIKMIYLDDLNFMVICTKNLQNFINTYNNYVTKLHCNSIFTDFPG